MRRRRRTMRRGAAVLAVLVAVAGLFAVARGNAPSAPTPAAITPNPVALKPPRERERQTGAYAAPPGLQMVGGRSIDVSFRRPPRAGLVFDMRTGEVLWRRRALEQMPIASLTQIMTAILVSEKTKPSERARVTGEALAYSGSGVGVLPRGKRVPVDGLMHGLMLPSGNDAAIALAGHVAGSDGRFARLMNRRARKLGLGCTRFVSSYGLQAGNRSCAADLAAMARVAMSRRRIARIVRKPTASVPFPIKSGRLHVNSTNPLLRERYRGTVGLKTGYTRKAGHCFVGVVRRGGRTFGVVLLHSPNPPAQSKKLLDAAFRAR